MPLKALLHTGSLSRKRLSSKAGGNQHDGDMWNAIPSIFFDPDFQLENPRVFDSVVENTSITTTAPSIGNFDQ